LYFSVELGVFYYKLPIPVERREKSFFIALSSHMSLGSLVGYENYLETYTDIDTEELYEALTYSNIF